MIKWYLLIGLAVILAFYSVFMFFLVRTLKHNSRTFHSFDVFGLLALPFALIDAYVFFLDSDAGLKTGAVLTFILFILSGTYETASGAKSKESQSDDELSTRRAVSMSLISIAFIAGIIFIAAQYPVWFTLVSAGICGTLWPIIYSLVYSNRKLNKALMIAMPLAALTFVLVGMIIYGVVHPVGTAYILLTAGGALTVLTLMLLIYALAGIIKKENASVMTFLLVLLSIGIILMGSGIWVAMKALAGLLFLAASAAGIGLLEKMVIGNRIGLLACIFVSLSFTCAAFRQLAIVILTWYTFIGALYLISFICLAAIVFIFNCFFIFDRPAGIIYPYVGVASTLAITFALAPTISSIVLYSDSAVFKAITITLVSLAGILGCVMVWRTTYHVNMKIKQKAE